MRWKIVRGTGVEGNEHLLLDALGFVGLDVIRMTRQLLTDLRLLTSNLFRLARQRVDFLRAQHAALREDLLLLLGERVASERLAALTFRVLSARPILDLLG